MVSAIERDFVDGSPHLGAVGINPIVVRIIGKSLLYSIYRAIDIGLGHARDLNWHAEGW